MTKSDIINNRLTNQHIVDGGCRKPEDIVARLGAMQAQEYAMAKWAIGLRLNGISDADVEKAFNDGAILRTHLLRPTWHFVTPTDIRWLLALTAPHINRLNAYYDRKLELDQTVLKRCYHTLVKTLQGKKQLTRVVLKSALQKAKIPADGLRLGLIMMHAELDGVICSGARQGRQFTYALLEERVPPARPFTREEALAELALRYFTSRGPVSVHDFAYWSGLSIKDAKSGANSLPADFTREIIDGKEYFLGPTASPIQKITSARATFLLPDYDEYFMSYKDRSAYLKDKNGDNEMSVFNHYIIIDGFKGGNWKRAMNNNAVTVETSLPSTLSKAKQQAVVSAVKRYNRFFEQD